MSSTHAPEADEKDIPNEEASGTSSDAVLEEAKEPSETKEKANVNNTDAVPNGGLKAWLQVAGSFFLTFNTWSVNYYSPFLLC